MSQKPVFDFYRNMFEYFILCFFFLFVTDENSQSYEI